ncbi:hypothetical protein F5X99DRAFT_432758 [Biscogniauxia marginata]|nr:hypothetical protein F5X99DRAFT_432758 [Biscogniauxia marginata]
MDSDNEYQPGDSDFDAEIPDEPGSLPDSTGEREPRGVSVPRKRRRSGSRQPSVLPSLKRVRGAFNFQYLSLLNEDIQDAAAGIIHEGGPPLERTQVGAVGWSAAEKEAFFSALGRLGRDDLAGIASRIRTKSEPEVRQYMILLDDFDRRRREDEDKRRRAVQLVDVPAAVEIGQECCAALEEAADGVALRQERYEETLEQKRWHGRWLITPALAQVLEHQHQHQRGGQQDHIPPFAELFAVRNWLRLSDRVFMNSAVPDGNWRYASEEAPSVRATAFADLHALAVSVTRRLLLASTYVAGSRIRAKNAGDPRHRTRPLVRAHDVRAAAASVGMQDDSRGFWARCARRLRLDVYDDHAELEDVSTDGRGDGDDGGNDSDNSESHEGEDGESTEEGEEEKGDIESSTDQDDDSSYDIMSYDAVEAALLDLPSPPATTPQDSSSSSDDTLSTISSSSSPPRSPAGEDVEMADDNNNDDDGDDTSDLDPDPAAVDRDLDEATTYSALPYAGKARAGQGLRARIRAEHALEASAERLDARARTREEARLWRMLRSRSDEEDPAATDAATGSEGEDAEEKEDHDGGEDARKSRSRGPGRRGAAAAAVVDWGPGWRDGLRYHSEWEGKVE